MTALDHRILIPTPPQAVWAYIGDLANLPEWQVDCEYMTFLSQKHQGIGTRWRQRAANRQEHVYEVVSWYDALGFEYTLIDGAPFKSVQGRIRLQEIPEGTIVQWSFNYELSGGMLGGLRNALSTERRQDKLMVDSLKTLWKQARRMGTLDDYVPRSMMQDGLQDPQERASYTGKRVTQTHETILPPTSEADAPVIPEPPVSDEDTRPRPSVVDAEVLPTHEQASEATPPPSTDTIDDNRESVRATDEHERFAPPERSTPPEAEDITAQRQAMSEQQSFTPPTPPSPAEEATPPSPAATTPPDPEPTPAAQPPIEDDETLPSGDNLAPQVPPDQDTGEMSIWEVFGIPSPTDTQRMRAIQAAEEAEAEYEAEQAVDAAPVETEAEDGAEQAIDAAPVDITATNETADASASDDTETPAEGSSRRAGVRSRLRRRTINIRRPGE